MGSILQLATSIMPFLHTGGQTGQSKQGFPTMPKCVKKRRVLLLSTYTLQ